MNGMTGFGRAEGAQGALRWAWEVRSVNGRGLDQRVRTPPGFDALEAAARALIAKRFARGSITANLQLTRTSVAPAATLNLEALERLLNALAPYASDPRVEKPRLDSLLRAPGVMESLDEAADPDARAAQDAAIFVSLESALDALGASRAEEGAALCALLSGHVDTIDELTERARGTAGAQPERIRARLADQISALLGRELDPDRLATEAAILATKADVREELDRLTAHVAAARTLLASEGAVGRKLDFLTQEFMREANTLCSKSSETGLTAIGLALKAAIDQLREQVQNVE